MKNTVRELIKCILGGIMISIGGIVYLACENRYVGALLFTCGLTTILCFSLGLFTGRAGQLAVKGWRYIPTLIITLIGNFIGCFLAGSYAGARGFSDVFTSRLDTPYGITFLSAVMCGILMFAAVEGYNRKGSLVLCFLCVPAFILAGAEHCVADMFFLACAGAYSLKSLVFMALVTAGNVVGCCIIPLYERLLSD